MGGVSLRPSSIDSFGQRTNPHQIVEDDESAHVYGSAIPPPSHTSGSRSRSTSRNGSRAELVGDPGFLSQSQSPPPGGGGYAPSIAGMSNVGSFNARSMNAVGVIQAEVKAGRKENLISRTRTLNPPLENTSCFWRWRGRRKRPSTTTLIELFTSSYSDEISALSTCRSAEIAQGLIKAGLVKHLLMKGLRGGEGAARLSACIGALVHTDAVIPDLVDHLKNSSSSPTPQTDELAR
ncbi:hypothetical protein VKT23_000036 [Stygiomarasmius scandens]|uniref:Uncharacterized protein n=1 Tax=Marasmiellus scandens TaxID=2682957 RepID=A0ABR1K8Z9_9AGAR